MFGKSTLLAVAGMAAAASSALFGVKSEGVVAPPPSPKAYTGGGFGRNRQPGPRGQAGDKLARMAGEGRIGRGGVR